jgi:hypothetical protein
VQAMEVGESLRSAARFFGIPPTSLWDHIYGRSLGRKRGRQGILSAREEAELVEYILKMQDLGWPMTTGLLRLKVAQICQDRSNPFTHGIPGQGWLRWFRRRHPELTLKSSQGLEVNKAKNLCPENVASLFGNLQILYTQHSYAPDHIWNCDEIGAQAGRNGGGTLVFAKKGAKSVYSIIPDQWEWLSVLSCVNAGGGYIPHFYIFRGKRMRRNYIARYELGATMAMQTKAWMIGSLFSSWIAHFVKALEMREGIFPTNWHLLILDGHNSHVILDVVYKAKQNGLDLLTLPSHTSHLIQPLDCSIFRPFKCAFRGYMDAWTLQNRGRPAQKEDLAEWVSLALERTLTANNIIQGFKGTGIWPLNLEALARKMGTSKQFKEVSIPGILDLEDDKRSRSFYDHIGESAGETSVEEGDDEVHDGLDFHGEAGGGDGFRSPLSSRNQTCSTVDA